MNIIGIETSGIFGSVCVRDENIVAGERTFGRKPGPGNEIVSSLYSIFQETALAPDDINLIAVSIGPGSYTGLRVGITCAKTLAYSLDIPVIGVPTLDVLAENVEGSVKTFCPVIDARRMCVYASIYERDSGMQKRVTDFLLIPPNDLLNILPEHTLIFGDAITPYKEIFTKKKLTISHDVSGVASALIVAQLGLKRYEQGERSEMEALEPLYLRKSEAEERLDIRR